MATPPKSSAAGGFLIAGGVLGGAIVGLLIGEATPGALIGLALGIAAAGLLWWRDR